jgi:hypothetical protein
MFPTFQSFIFFGFMVAGEEIESEQPFPEFRLLPN